MDPPSPSKLAMSPGMPIFPVSPERVAGTRPLYGEPVQMSPSAPNLRTLSPLRNSHRRNDSDVSVQGLAVMFENLEVKDSKEAAKRFKDALEKEKARNTERLNKIEKEHARKEKEHELALSRRDVRIDELQSKLEEAEQRNEAGVTKAQYEKERKAHKANVAQWEKVFKQNEDKWRSTQAKLTESDVHGQAYEQKYREYKKKWMESNKENLRSSGMIPTLQTKIQGLQRNVQRAESDVKFKTEEAAKYQNQVYSLQIELEGVNARLGEEIQTLKDRLRLIEGERDALKTSLKEEEVMRVAAEGHIPLPATGIDEDVEFGSPVRSPRKQHTFPRVDDDKENVSPKKGMVELRFLQQELATEKRLRERAQDQIDFMKMECQFQCCSCRIAESKGKKYVHDDMYAAEMQRIKMSVPAFTPPASNHGDDIMDDAVIKQEPVDVERPFTPPSEDSINREHDIDNAEQNDNNTILIHPQDSDPEAAVTFSPSTGTFRSVPSPKKATTSVHDSTPAKLSPLGFSAVTEIAAASSPWTLDAHSTMIPTEVVPASTLRPEPEAEPIRSDLKENKVADISIHEDAIEDTEEEDFEPPTPSHEPSGPATPYLTRTITTTTTIPLHFSPATPAFKPGRGPMTPSTVAHAAADARTPVLGELSLNKLPFDREAALEAIRQRRGRARSMAAGHGTPMKQMVEGVKDRRDISAPVSRVRR
ncbi:Nn.00g007920.m01.CDS01 [Neocucurbitaria sp. VM-36]